MPLPPAFQFSQNNLQDYVDCPRRFELRHLLRLEWPALQSEPVLEHERQMALGEQFHRLVQQYLSGMAPSLLEAQVAADPDLERWWSNFLQSGILDDLPAARYSERQLSAPFRWGGEHSPVRLVGQYDLLAVDPGRRAVILDWKTGKQGGARPSSLKLQARLQTRLYPLLLCLAGQHLNGGAPIQPEKVEMIYWFSDHPQATVRFQYSDTQMAADQTYLRSLIAEIRNLAERSQPFLLTPDARRCAFCAFRSLCKRGAQAGNLDEIDEEIELADDEPLGLDFENLDPIQW